MLLFYCSKKYSRQNKQYATTPYNIIVYLYSCYLCFSMMDADISLWPLEKTGRQLKRMIFGL